jgi:photosystem II S4 domain protein
VTSFYSPAVISDARKVLERMADVECIAWGGYERAERQKLLLGREEVLYACEEEMKEKAVAVVNVQGNFLFDKASHPDFLGSVLGTGIERSVIGDILVQGESGAHVLCSPSIVEHLESALVQVRSVPVRTEAIDSGTQLRVPEARVKEIHSVENSQRLDAVASAGFRMSRSKMADMIKAGDVRVNWKECKKPSVDVAQGDVISAKGYGRLEISSISMSSKGKFIVDMSRYY